MSSQIKWTLVPVLAIAPAAITIQSAHAIVYLNEQQAQQAIFGNAKMTKNFITLTDDQAKEIKAKSKMDVRHKELQIWDVDGGGKFIIDEVLGKHEYITYAIGLNKDGSVKQIEIMNYNESYGYEVRNESWRKQFIGKTTNSDLYLEHDIKNISGATLSCKHITDGVRRVLVTYNLIKK
ncbi:MAG: FMN-binding protein [Proteobacteria bacterium]|nr:FMN-binding protein [Pseudomonadota bacterium]